MDEMVGYFEKLKDALDNQYLYDSLDYGEEVNEVDNLDDYLKLIKQERAIEKDLEEDANNRLKTYQEFISYLADKAVGDTSNIIEEFNNCAYVSFEGYKEVTKEVVNNHLCLNFQIGEMKLKAEWQQSDNYGVWQRCGYNGDDFSGYMLYPTYKENEYFCVYYQC